MRKSSTLRERKQFWNIKPGNLKAVGQNFQKYIMSRGLPTLCDGPEKPTQWKSESVSNGQMDQPT